MDKFEIFGIIMIILAVSIPIIIFVGGTDMKELHNETCIILDKYEDEHIELRPIATGKGMITQQINHHDYYFNTTKGVIPVTSKEYNYYNVSDTLNISVNGEGGIREILN